MVLHKKRKRDMRFGTWNVRSLYRARLFTAAVRELGGYKLYLVGVQRVDRKMRAQYEQGNIFLL